MNSVSSFYISVSIRWVIALGIVTSLLSGTHLAKSANADLKGPGDVYTNEELTAMSEDWSPRELEEFRLLLVDRYNLVINRAVAFKGGVDKVMCPGRSKTSECMTAIQEAGVLLSDEKIKRQIHDPQTDVLVLGSVKRRLLEAETAISDFERIWLKYERTSAATADKALGSICRAQAVLAQPMVLKNQTDFEHLIDACKVASRTSIRGMKVSREGPKPVVSPSPKPTPPPRPKPPKPSLTPSEAKVTVELRDELAGLPKIPGMKIVVPPPKSEVIAQARKWVHGYDPLKIAATEFNPALAEFLFSAEAPDRTIKNVYEYSYARARWKQTIDLYREKQRSQATTQDLESQLQLLVGLLHDDFLHEYTRAAARITDFMNGRGGNCEAESKLLFSMFAEIQLVLPPGKRLVAQLFSDHIQPIIYDEQTDEAINLMTGHRETGTPVDLYDPMIVVNAFLRKQMPVYSRKNEDFVRIRANRESDPSMLARLAGSGILNTNTSLEFPKSEVRFSLAPVPEHARLARPNFFKMVMIDEEEVGSPSKSPTKGPKGTPPSQAEKKSDSKIEAGSDQKVPANATPPAHGKASDQGDTAASATKPTTSDSSKNGNASDTGGAGNGEGGSTSSQSGNSKMDGGNKKGDGSKAGDDSKPGDVTDGGGESTTRGTFQNGSNLNGENGSSQGGSFQKSAGNRKGDGSKSRDGSKSGDASMKGNGSKKDDGSNKGAGSKKSGGTGNVNGTSSRQRRIGDAFFTESTETAQKKNPSDKQRIKPAPGSAASFEPAKAKEAVKIPTPRGHDSGGNGDQEIPLKSTFKKMAIHGRSEEVSVALYKAWEDGENHSRCSDRWHYPETICYNFDFRNPDDFDAALLLNDPVAIARLAAEKRINLALKKMRSRNELRTLREFMRNPKNSDKIDEDGLLNDIISTVEDWAAYYPGGRKALVAYAYRQEPNLEKALDESKRFATRLKAQPYAFTEIWIKTPERKDPRPYRETYNPFGHGIWTALHLSYYLEGTKKEPNPLYAPMLDAKHAVWSDAPKGDDAKSKKKNSESEKQSEVETIDTTASDKPENPVPEELPIDLKNARLVHIGAFTPPKTETEEKMVFPKKAMVIPVRLARSALYDLELHLTPSQRRDVYKLWKTLPAKKRFRLDPSYVPPENRCGIYGTISYHEPTAVGCVPKENGPLLLADMKSSEKYYLQQDKEYGGSEVMINGEVILLKYADHMRLIEDQMAGRTPRKDLADKIAKARAAMPNPDLLTDAQIDEEREWKEKEEKEERAP